MWPHCSLSAVQRQTNSEPFPDLILVFYVEGDFCRFALALIIFVSGEFSSPVDISVFRGCGSNSQDSPKASARADRARGRKGDRKTYGMYTMFVSN